MRAMGVAVADVPEFTKHYQPGVPARIELPTESLVEMFERSCRQAGGRTACVFFGAETSYRQLGDQVNRAAEGLRRLGVVRGDRVAIVLPNCPQHLVAFYAVLRLGGIVVEHNPLFTGRELGEMFADHGARVAIAMDTVVDKLAEQPDYTRPRHIVSVNLLKAFPRVKQLALSLPLPKLKQTRAALTNGAKGTLSWEQLLNHRPVGKRVPRPKVHDLAVIQYTSGTTGEAKGAMLTHYNLYANARQGAAWMIEARTGEETQYCMLPMFHAFGMTLYLTFGVLKQARQVLFPRPDVDLALAEMKKYPPSIYCAVPVIYERTASKAAEQGISLRSIRWCISGAVTLSEHTVQLWEEVSGGRLVEGYGLTETSPVALGNPFCDSRKTGTIGIPFPSTQMLVVKADDPTQEVAQGEPGELLLKGPQVFQGYWNNRAETERALLPGGWLRTGDIVTVDEDGFATIVDRLKEIIITSGFNVSPSEVEQELRQHEAIADVSVVGLKREQGDEVAVAAVVLAEGRQLDEAALRAWAKERLAAYKVPRHFVVVDDLPKSLLGKVLRGQVRAAIADRVPAARTEAS